MRLPASSLLTRIRSPGNKVGIIDSDGTTNWSQMKIRRSSHPAKSMQALADIQKI